MIEEKYKKEKSNKVMKEIAENSEKLTPEEWVRRVDKDRRRTNRNNEKRDSSK